MRRIKTYDSAGVNLVPLADRLRDCTRDLHRPEAEKTGIVAELLRGKASRKGYALLLRNLLPVYEALECALQRHSHRAALSKIANPALYRFQAIVADLNGIAGAGWQNWLALLPAASVYAQSIEAAASASEFRLIAHAYVRYLGDLSGGQILRRLLMQSLGLPPQNLAFYSFTEITDVTQFKNDYRQAISDATADLGIAKSILCEALLAFELNIQVSVAVQSAEFRRALYRNPPSGIFGRTDSGVPNQMFQ